MTENAKLIDMIDLTNRLLSLDLAPVSADMDDFIRIMCEFLDFAVHEYPSGNTHNGWIVPDSWKFKKCEIWHDGNCIYKGKNCLSVVGYSPSFCGTVDLETLKQHLFYHPVLHDSEVYHCDYYYKTWKKEWGISVSKDFYDSLVDGQYEVVVETLHEPGHMKVLEFNLLGKTSKTIILNAHTCHAHQANDGISGIVVAIQLIQILKSWPNRRYSYRVVLAPEHIGTVFYLNQFHPESFNAVACIFLEMLGNNNSLALQESFSGNHLIDRAILHCLKHEIENHRNFGFRKLVGNDETVWESPGYEVPCPSLSRFPYQEYHSVKDNIDIINLDNLNESIRILLQTIKIMETNCIIRRNFEGLLALSHPSFDLYKPTADPSIRTKVDDDSLKWNHFMNCVIRHFDMKSTVLDISEKYGIYYFDVKNYLDKFLEKELISYA